MKWLKFSGALFVTLSLFAVGSWAADETRTFQVSNRLRFEYDDNVYETKNNKTGSLNTIEEVEFLVNLNLQQTYIGIRYRPTFEWWSNRSNDKTDIHHDLDVTFNHNFTQRLSVSLKDTLVRAQQPQLISGGAVIRENNDFYNNVADAKVAYLIAPKTRLEVGYRNTLLRYDDNNVATNDDYDINAVGVTLRHQALKNTVIAADYRYEDVSYLHTGGGDRGSKSQYAGATVEQIFSPSLVGSVRAGYQKKEFSDSSIKNASDPYGEASMTYLPSPRTRLTAGGSYSLFEADVSPFASQDRTVAFLSAAHDLTAKIQLFASGSYQYSQYHGDQAVSATKGGNENVYQFSARATYKINRNNWLDAGWQYLKLDSQPNLREDFAQNRIEIGWRMQL